MQGLGIYVATRRVEDAPDRVDRCTEFQIHVGRCDNVVDFTEFKLLRYSASLADAQQKLIVAALIIDYRTGNIAIAWRRGKPVPLRITHEKM